MTSACRMLCLTVFSLCLPGLVAAHVGARVYPIAYLSDDMLEQIDLKDGSVEEWYEVVGEPSMTLLDFGEGDLGPLDPSDLDFRIWLAWHDNPARFYLAFVSSDDIYENSHDYNVDGFSVQDDMSLNDSITLVIDGDHSGGAGCSLHCPWDVSVEANSGSQKYDAIARTLDGPNLDDRWARGPSGFAWNALPPYGDAGGSVAGENPTISVIELYVTPFDRRMNHNIEESREPAGQSDGVGGNRLVIGAGSTRPRVTRFKR